MFSHAALQTCRTPPPWRRFSPTRFIRRQRHQRAWPASVGRRINAFRYGELCIATHCCPWQISWQATGLLWNLIFDHAVEKVSDDDSGRSRVANTDKGRIPAERLQPKVAYYAGDPALALDLSREAGAQLSAAIHACGSRRAPRVQADREFAVSRSADAGTPTRRSGH